ncbi:unnamed protein product [Dibothriocephalus latus]|uniref:DUF4806 domain-containing protein n=1 Tax=Dibothriocephalus latus TaxID=60516 RepID=A0A3P7QMV6_DIBLA|nr:unnamed protein product [Dibothriocephalus latus]
MDNCEVFERKLQDLDFWQRAVAYLQMQGGKMPRVFVNQMTNLLFDKRLLAKFNMSGTYNKKNFCETKAYELLQDLYLPWSKKQKTTIKEFRAAIHCVFKAAGRKTRKDINKRDSTLSSCTNENP